MNHNLEELSEKNNREYFIYLLDYAWEELLGDALRKNFGQMAILAVQWLNETLWFESSSLRVDSLVFEIANFS